MPYYKKNPARPEDDFYETPIAAIDALISYHRFEGSIHEPCPGDGAIVRALSGYKVTVGKGDFFEDRGRYWNIIMNPPYRCATEFVEHALKITERKVAALLRLTFLEGQRRYSMFKNSPLEQVLVFSNRICMQPGGGEGKNGKVAYAWFIWNKEYRDAPTIDWIFA